MIGTDRRLSGAARVVKLVCMAGLFLLLCAAVISPLHAAQPIKIGVVLSLTGWGGSAGTPILEAMEVMTEKTNREGGVLGRPIELYVEDDQSNPTNASVAATKLIRDKGVCVVVGSLFTNMSMPMLPIVEKEHVLNLPFSAGRDITIPLKKWVFRAGALTDEQLSPVLLKFVVEKLGARNIALLHSTDASGMMGAKGIKEDASQFGVKVIIEEQFEPNDTNMIAQLTRVKASRPDAIVLYTSPNPAAVIAKNYQQLGMDHIPLVGSHTVPTQDFIRLAGDSAKTWTMMGPKTVIAEKLPPDDAYRKTYYDPFMILLTKKYGPTKEFKSFHGHGATAIAMVSAILNKAGTDDRAALRDAMETLSIDTMNGRFTYSPTNHDGTDSSFYGPLIIKEGHLWPWKYRDSEEIPANPHAMAFP